MFLLPIGNVLSSNGWFETAKNYYMAFLQNLNAQTAFANISDLFNSLHTIINNNFASIGFNVVGFVIVMSILGTLFSNFFSVIVTNSLYQSMSNNVKYGFYPSMFSTLKTNLNYSVVSLFIKIPISVIISCLVYLSFDLLFVGGMVSFFAPLLIMLIMFFLITIKTTIFYGWTPAIVVFDKGVFYALAKSLQLTFRRIKRVFANSFYMVITIFVVNVFCALVSFGSTLILTLPMSILLYHAFAMVMFYSNYGMRYYVDEFNVIVPSKLEQTEPFCNVKYII
jgi:hypothetical protein